MADLTKEELKQFISETMNEKLSGLKTEGGKMPDNSEYVTVKDFEHQKTLAQLAANAEKKETEYQQAIKTLSNQLKETLDPNHRKHCVGPNCQVNQVHSQIFQEGLEKGKADALANLKVDDIPPKLVGEWIRVMRQREGK